MPTYDEGRSQDDRVIETASGTTSSSNSDSGSFAYVIAAVAIALMLLVGTGLSGCMSLVSGLIEDEIGGGDYYTDTTDSYDNDYNYDYDFGDNFFNEDFTFEDMLEHLENEEQGGTVPVNTTEPSSIEEVLGGSLSMYDTTIDSLLPAMSYANANPTVRDYVRDVVLVDRDAASELHSILLSAAWGETELPEALEQASEKAEATAEELRDKQLPAVEGAGAAEASRQLELGRTAAIDRWVAIASELDVLAGMQDAVDTTSLSDADAEVASAAYDAAAAFGAALSASASL